MIERAVWWLAMLRLALPMLAYLFVGVALTLGVVAVVGLVVAGV